MVTSEKFTMLLLLKVSFVLSLPTQAVGDDIGIKPDVSNQNDISRNTSVMATTFQRTPTQRQQILEETISDENETILVSGLGQFCKLYLISPEECNCSNLTGKYKMKLSLCFSIESPTMSHEPDIKCTVPGKIRDIVIIVISLVGICGNLLVVMVTFVHKQNLPKFRIIIGMLGFSDLVFSVLQLIIYSPGLWTCHWVYNTAMCKLLHSSAHAMSMMALGLISIVAIERYNGIVRPFLRQLSFCKNIYRLVCLDGLFSIAFTIPMLLKLETNECHFCVERWQNNSHSLIYNWILLVFTFLLPVIATSAFYVSIVKALYKSKDATERIIGIKQKERRRKEDRRITSIIAYLLMSFVILVSPNRLLMVLQDHGIFSNVPGEKISYIQLAALLPYAIHSTINPFIYSIIDKKFRENIRQFYYTVMRRRSSAKSFDLAFL